MKNINIESLSYELGILMAVAKEQEYLNLDECVGAMIVAIGKENLDKEFLYKGIKAEIQNQNLNYDDVDDEDLEEYFNDVLEYFENDLN